MSWRDILIPKSASESSAQNPHNSQKSVSVQVSGDSENTGEQKVASLRDQTRQAGDWNALSAVLDVAQTAYDSGEVSREEVESLAGYVAERSHEVPENTEQEDCRLSELLASKTIVRVRSRLLGEVVVWVADGVEVPVDTTEVVYRESELRGLVGRPPEELRAIHKAKRALDGQLMDESCPTDHDGSRATEE